MKAHKAYTLAELIVSILLIVVLTGVAVPRLQFGLTQRKSAEAIARKIVIDLRRARSLAILNAATNSDGFAVSFDWGGDGATYDIVDLSDQSIVDSHVIASGIDLSGQTRFEFDSLGALKEPSSPSIEVSTSDMALTISVIPSTGMVTCAESASGGSPSPPDGGDSGGGDDGGGGGDGGDDEDDDEDDDDEDDD